MIMDDLYSEILYQILHNVSRCDYIYVSKTGTEVEQRAMLSYIQGAFKMSHDKHSELLKEAEAKEYPELMLNVEVVEGKDLVPKDPTGLSDPFVTIYLMSNTAHRYNTSVKSATLNPTWEEHFSLFVPGTLRDDSLCLEVWDASEPKNYKNEEFENTDPGKADESFRKSASMKKQDNLIGTAKMPLQSISAGEISEYLYLNNKSKSRQGILKVNCSFSLDKDMEIALQEHRNLLRILLVHELESSEASDYWEGNFSAPAEAILTEHKAQSMIGRADNWLVQWTVYCDLCAKCQISFTVFNDLLDKITSMFLSTLTGSINDDNVKLFWKSAKRLLPVCFDYINKKRDLTFEGNEEKIERYNIYTLREVLNIIDKLTLLEIPESIDLFPTNLYGWLRDKDDGTKLSIHEVLSQVVIQGASDWFVHILDSNECKDKTEESRLQHLIRVIQLVRSDLQRAVEYYDRVFAEVLLLSYSKVLSEVYENKITSLMEPEVILFCKSLKRLQYNETSSKQNREEDHEKKPDVGLSACDKEPSTTGKTLFELYLTLKRLGHDLSEIKSNHAKFYAWFFGGVSLWLDMAAFKCFMQIEKAVELDNLLPLVLDVKYSSSSVDTLTIFYQIYQTFWKQLAWPDDEGSFSFVTNIINDICRCCVFYSERMSRRVEGAGAVLSVFEERFEVTTEWWVAINNIDYVRQSLAPFVVELGMDDIIQRMCEANLSKREKYRETFHSMIENIIDTVRNKMDELLEVMIKKIIFSLMKLLIDYADALQQEFSSMDRVMRYLETNFDTVHQHLSSENFSRTLDLFWVQLSEDLYNTIQINIRKRPPCWFKNLRQCLKVMEQSLCGDDKEIYKSETLKCVEYLLEIHGTETVNLIHQYQLERWQEQQAITEPKMGMLTVRAQFIEDHLKIEIMNASQLAPVNTNSKGNTFVMISLLPDDTFGDVEKLKTKIYYNSCYPLYDEIFVIPLSGEQSRLEDGLVHLVVKDKDMFSVSNTFVGEAYLHFTEVPHTPAPISSLPQQRLKLSRPTSFDDDKIKVLEFRQDDKQARKFIQKEKQKIPNNKSLLSLAVPVLAIPTPFVRFLPSKVLSSLTQLTGRKSKLEKFLKKEEKPGTFNYNEGYTMVNP